MSYKQFGNGLGTVILLIFGLNVFNSVVPFLVRRIVPLDWLLFAMTYYSWIGQLIFGTTIYWLVRGNKIVSAPIGLLSTVLPFFGALFYLLTLIKSKKVNEGQEV